MKTEFKELEASRADTGKFWGNDLSYTPEVEPPLFQTPILKTENEVR